MELVQGQTIEGESLSIDEKRFIDCVLIDCVLEYRGSPVSFTRTRMKGLSIRLFRQRSQHRPFSSRGWIARPYAWRMGRVSGDRQLV